MLLIDPAAFDPTSRYTSHCDQSARSSVYLTTLDDAALSLCALLFEFLDVFVAEWFGVDEL